MQQKGYGFRVLTAGAFCLIAAMGCSSAEEKTDATTGANAPVTNTEQRRAAIQNNPNMPEAAKQAALQQISGGANNAPPSATGK